MEEVRLKTVVLSIAGRDKGKIFAVTGVADDNHATIADGRLRKLQKPKKKKLKHVKPQGQLDAAFTTVRELHKALNDFAAQHNTGVKRG